MKWISSLFLLLMLSTNVFSQSILGNGGGDDAGNGGFAYKQSMKILKLASDGLEGKIRQVDVQEFKDHPEWRTLLAKVLKHDNLEKKWWRSKSRNGQPLSMDYEVRNPKVIVLKAYYQAFMGKTNNEIDESVLETQKRLIHEASHIWGYNEEESEEFAERFLIYADHLATRTSGDISINPNFCSCLNGKSDIVNNCNDFCAKMPKTNTPTLYLDVILGDETLKNPNTNTLYKWCNNQLEGDAGTPGCTLEAWDGINKISNIPVIIKKDSNNLTAEIATLAYNQTYILKVVESKSGSSAQTKEFQLRRVKQTNPDDLLPIKLMPVNQYSCLTYSGKMNSDGTIYRENFVRNYYNYPSNENPEPVPYAGDIPLFVCHDEVQYGPKDSTFYPRLESIINKITLLDKVDPAFVYEGNDFKINSVINNRLADEYGMSVHVNIINPLYLKATNSKSKLAGFYVSPFINPSNNQAYCPKDEDFNGSVPLLRIMKDYFSELEGLYIAESEAVTINNNGTYLTFYPNQFVRASEVVNYGFYMQNGLKIKANNQTIHNRTIYFYYPFSDVQDPLIQGDRKLFTIRNPDELNNPQFKTRNLSLRTSDKRIGCIPKSNSGKPQNGNLEIGSNCASDYQCSSLCCNSSTGSCASHDPLKNLFCAKEPGQFCIAKEFCKKEYVPVCKLYKNGMNTDGTPKCVVRCPSVEKFGDCVQDTCLEPRGDTDTSKFDLNTCQGAIDP